MTLQHWIEKKTHKKVAQLLKVAPSSVSEWHHKKKSPSPKHMLKIVKLTRGKVSLLSLVQQAATTNHK